MVKTLFAKKSRIPAAPHLVIGCDGTWSRVRPILTSVKAAYSGVTLIETRVESPDLRHPVLARLVGAGNILAVGDNKALMAQRNGDGHLRVYIALRVSEDWVTNGGIDFKLPAKALESLLGLFEGWSPELLNLLCASDDIFLPRPLYTLPANQSWATRPGITILGDAAHVMPPFTGQGANLAMLDAVELAECLTLGGYTTPTEAIRAFEQKMLSRMQEAIHATLASQDLIISPNAPVPLVDAIRHRLSGQ